MCQIYGVQVNLVTPPAGPRELIITGQATNCAANQVLVTSSVTNPSGPVVVNPQGRFRILLPVTQQVQCGDVISVRVECNQDPNCFWQNNNLQVPCCTVQVASVQAVVPLGSLSPTSIRVTGTLLGCYNDQVVVRILTQASTIGPSSATAVDPYTGSFSVTLPIPTNISIQCDDRITAEAWCAQDTTCRAKRDVRLDCPGCARASLSYTAGACSGTPPQQPVTLNATISIPASQTLNFQWDYGDGTFGTPFSINNTTGTGATQYTHSEPPHNYTPGQYTARLLIVGPPFECDIFSLPITVQCFQCPIVTGSVNVGPCETDHNSSTYGYRQVTYTLNFSPAIPQNAQAWVTWNYGGSALSLSGQTVTQYQQQIPTQAGGVAVLTHQIYLKHKSGGYPSSATVTLFHQGQACAPSNVQFAFPSGITPPVVMVDPCLPCPDQIVVNRVSPANLPCAPTNSNLQFQASVVWPQGTINPPSPSGYDWAITLPAKTGQPIRQAKYTNGPANVDITNGWTGNGATAAGSVDLSNDGTYSVGVTAKFPISAGLPTNADGTSQCNLTGSYSFTLQPCNPPVPPKVTGCSVTSGASGAGSVGVTFDMDVEPSSAINPSNYSISIGGGPAQNPSPGSLSYDSATRTTTITGLSINAGDTVSVTVTGVRDATGTVTIGAQNSTSCSAPSDGGGFNFCTLLLILAIALLIIGGLLIIIGVCSKIQWILIASAIVAGIGLLLFIAWAIWCSATTLCSVMQTVHCILFWIVAVVMPIVAFIVWLLSGFNFKDPCFIATVGTWGGWGTLYTWLGFIMGRVGCPRNC